MAARDGGSATAILQTCAALNAAGVDSMVLTTTADGASRTMIRDTGHAVVEAGVPVWFCRRSRPRLLKNSWQLARRSRRLAMSGA